MIEAPIPVNETARLHVLHELGILDTLEEQAYDDLTLLAAEVCDTPIALVTLVDSERQWFKSHHGLAVRETPRSQAFCAHAILQDDVFVVENAGMDERFHDNPLVIGQPDIQFYAGAPLIMPGGSNVGTLCVIGHEERQLSPTQARALQALARQVVSQLELRLQLKELEVLDHAKDEFVSMVSHELRTPLTSIYGSLSLLVNEDSQPLGDSRPEIVSMAYRNTERLMGLVNDILDLSKLQSGLFQLELGELAIDQLIATSVELNRQYCESCEVELRFEYSDPSPVIVNGDEKRLLQVLSNLISNAAKFSGKHDQVQILLETDHQSVTVSVLDHGPGISTEHQGLLFKKFSQLGANVDQKLPGTGLGLSICKQLIELHQGVIGFESNPDVATRFYFRLPLHVE